MRDRLRTVDAWQFRTALPFDLSGHVALVTGGNGGIGLGMADALAAHGADVAIWGTNPDKNDAAIEQLGRHDVELLSIVCDVGDEDAVVQAFADTVGELGRVDSCFVNAGVGGQAPSFVGMTSDEWRRVMRVNLDGAFFTSREAARHMVARAEDGDDAGGSIVFTTSGSAFFGQQSGQHYGASKAGVNSMMKAIAVQHARHGIRCNSILPGLDRERHDRRRLRLGPVRREGAAAGARCAAGVSPPTSAASPSTSRARRRSYHTGDVITIDGGYHSF